MEFSKYYKNLSADDIKRLSPLVLAFIGDSVYEEFVRTYLIGKFGDIPVHKLHIKAISFVKAHAQYVTYLKLEDILSEDEKHIFKKGRNANPGTVPKNAIVKEYRYATGFEALIGYLYLSNQDERLEDLMDKVIELYESGQINER